MVSIIIKYSVAYHYGHCALGKTVFKESVAIEEQSYYWDSQVLHQHFQPDTVADRRLLTYYMGRNSRLAVFRLAISASKLSQIFDFKLINHTCFYHAFASRLHAMILVTLLTWFSF